MRDSNCGLVCGVDCGTTDGVPNISLLEYITYLFEIVSQFADHFPEVFVEPLLNRNMQRSTVKSIGKKLNISFREDQLDYKKMTIDIIITLKEKNQGWGDPIKLYCLFLLQEAKKLLLFCSQFYIFYSEDKFLNEQQTFRLKEGALYNDEELQKSPY